MKTGFKRCIYHGIQRSLNSWTSEHFAPIVAGHFLHLTISIDFRTSMLMQTSNPVDYDMKVTKIVLPALVIVSRTTLVFPLCPPTTVISDLEHITSTGKSF